MCQNLEVNVHVMHDLGIDSDAFGSPLKAEPRIIRFPGG